MTASKRFVVGIDGSSHAHRALRWAIAEAVLWDAQLDVVHTWASPLLLVPPPISLGYEPDLRALEQSARDVLEREIATALDESAGASPTIGKVLTGEPAADALIEAAKGAELLVVGSRGLGGFRGLLLGSVSNHCVHHAPCPVAVIRGERSGEIDRSQRRIVVGVDGSDDSFGALVWAISESRQSRAELAAVMAWSWLDQPGEFDPGYGADDVEATAQAFVARGIAETGAEDGSVEIRIVNDHPAYALVEASKSADLLVVGSRGLGALRRLQLGSVSTHCVHHADCPVVVVRQS